MREKETKRERGRWIKKRPIARKRWIKRYKESKRQGERDKM